ncbi:MAG: pyridoxamine 5'-phosphate oxidase [Deltaproteobacteria bacterium RIFOXYA12_FULL_58_15]|nr:MAG: pyridoxamine 5'-phosphate oxidase [Deltaproteobacteria bacterium RIFOXYA12_FULL_58_15]
MMSLDTINTTATNPLVLLSNWLQDAAAHGAFPNPNAMSLATVDPDGRPSNRIVLCKEIDAVRGGVKFYTNYESRKAVAQAHNPFAAATFYWDAMARQARVEGVLQRLSAAESDAYFASRPIGARIGAWVSRQSRPLASKDELMGTFEEAGRGARGRDVSRPPHWGGYFLLADRVELWVARDHRLHERVLWSRPLHVNDDGSATSTGDWMSTLLYP